MTMNEKQHKAVIDKLERIQVLLQNLVILQGAQTEMTKADVRKLASVGNKRMTDVWASVKVSKGK